jgi:DNA-directed RNA polymerase specialized sigma24 family protein
MKVTDKSRLLGRTKAPKPRNLRGRLGESPVGSFREKLDWRWLCACVRWCGVRGAEAEEIAQEALVVAARVQTHPRPPLHPGQTEQQARRALLRRILRHLVWGHFRRRDRQRTEPCEDMARFSGDAPCGDERMIVQEDEREQQRRNEVVKDALAHLARTEPNAHAVLEAYELRGEPVVDIAARLSIPLGTAHARLRKGRSELVAFVKRHEAKTRKERGRGVGGGLARHARGPFLSGG